MLFRWCIKTRCRNQVSKERSGFSLSTADGGCASVVTIVVGYVVFIKEPLETLLKKNPWFLLLMLAFFFFFLFFLGTYFTLKARSKCYNFPELHGSCNCGLCVAPPWWSRQSQNKVLHPELGNPFPSWKQSQKTGSFFSAWLVSKNWGDKVHEVTNLSSWRLLYEGP